MKHLNLQTLLKSNPVFVFQQSANNPFDRRLFQSFEKALSDEGVFLPQATREFWGNGLATPTQTPVRPGVNGLAYQRKEKTSSDYALVCPLKARLQKHWHVSSRLPFSVSELLEFTDTLFADFYKMHDFNGLPERFAFSIDGVMDEPVHGPSMTAAGFLAMLDAAHSNKNLNGVAQIGAAQVGHPLLSAATAVIQREGGKLCPVDGERVKVGAFIREFGRGTLLVCASKACAREFKPWFDHIWQVHSMSDFASKLKETGLLSVFARRRPLVLEDAVNVAAQMERIENLMDFDRALAIVQRAISCGFANDLPEKWKRRFFEFQNRQLRLTGHTIQSADKHADFLLYLNSDKTLICKEEQLKAVRGYAASLYDCHRFETGLSVLEPLINEILISPQSYHPNSRTFTWNTYGMLGSVRGLLPEWESFHIKALELQKRWDLTRVHRTLNYMLQGHIRLNQMDCAKKVIQHMLEAGPMDNSSSVYFTIYHAYFHRALGKVWTLGDPLMANQKDPYLKAMYFQATARMKGIPHDESRTRLEKAIRELENNRYQPARGVRIFLLNTLQLLLATKNNDREKVEQSTQNLKSFLNLKAYASFKAFYTEAMTDLESNPNPQTAENLIHQIPHF